MEDAAQGVAQIGRPASSRESYQHLEILAGLDLRIAKVSVELKDLGKMSHSMRKELDTATGQARRHIHSLEAMLLEHAKAIRELQHRFDRQPDERKQPMSADRLPNSAEIPLSPMEVAVESKIAQLRSTLRSEILQELSMQGFKSAPEEINITPMGNATGAEIGTAQTHATRQLDQANLHEECDLKCSFGVMCADVSITSADRKDSAQVEEAKHESTQAVIANLVFDEYHFNSSIWDAAIFFFLPQVGAGATFVVMFSLILLNWMLTVFVGIIMTSFLQPNSFGPETQEALRIWRNEIAHSSTYADWMRGTSLASRVCSLDLALDTSSFQVLIVANLHAYLPDLESCMTVRCKITQLFFTGPMLVLLSIVVWSLAVSTHAHSICKMGRALIGVPHGRTTHVVFDGERLELTTMTTTRKAFALFLVLLRLVFSMTLWITGSSFLIYSVTPANILLNALSLEFVLHLNELLYHSLAPLQVHGLIDNLKPLQLSPWRRFAGADAFTTAIPVFLIGNVLVVFYAYLLPFIDDMEASAEILCGGNVDFIYTSDAVGVMWAIRSPAFRSSVLPLQQYEVNSVKQAITSWSTAVALGALRLSEPHGKSDPSGNFEHLQHVSEYPYFKVLSAYPPALSADKGSHELPSNPYAVYHLRQLLQNQSGNCSDVSSILAIPSCYQNYKPGSHPYYGRHTASISRIQALCQTGCGCHSPWFGTIFKSDGGCPGVETSEGFQAALIDIPCEDPSGHLNSTIISRINEALMQNPEITRLGLAWPATASPDFCAFAYPLFKDHKSVWTTFCPATWGCKYTNLSRLGEKNYCPRSCPCNLNGCS